jgi:hypothetical protein
MTPSRFSHAFAAPRSVSIIISPARISRPNIEEMAWREHNRRVSNGEQYLLVVNSASAHLVSRQWKGYWQRPHKRGAPSKTIFS